ncbi:hypothetical protein [Xanthovirga aplysinae]|uniref:hypothetical protein n=1 Tax=Xanthovirga aplysinae TaxID=2529853 RepID=UPI0012BB96D1|nr:hypothetical protein [Xanthovirga aplysinae]MTI32521.1 hypothetical protein [Xanthovirga aplysinae]
MKCSVCSGEIDEKYCPKCGQYFNNERITSISVLKDLFGSIFSLEKSFLINIKMGLLQPNILISNYWNGYRGYYYSPSRFLTIASLFFLLELMLVNDFFGISVRSKVSPQFTLLFLNLVVFTFSSFIIYLEYKKSFYEHLILNIYNVSLWSIIFVPVSVILSLFNTHRTIEAGFFFLFQLFIIVWNAKAFEMNKFKRLIYVALNCIFLVILILVLIYSFGTSTR